MSVILNESALTALLEKPGGPVARLVEREAEKIAQQMRKDVGEYFPGIGVEDDVDVEMEGSSATVGLRNDPLGRHTSPGEGKSERYARTGRFENTRRAAGQ